MLITVMTANTVSSTSRTSSFFRSLAAPSTISSACCGPRSTQKHSHLHRIQWSKCTYTTNKLLNMKNKKLCTMAYVTASTWDKQVKFNSQQDKECTLITHPMCDWDIIRSVKSVKSTFALRVSWQEYHLNEYHLNESGMLLTSRIQTEWF